MRLRPSGNKGPVATRISAFEKYQREEAWTWEHMALSRARLVCGEDTLMEDARRIIASILSRKRDLAKVSADVLEMRNLIEQEKPPENIWDFKLINGGLIDLEFIAQYLTLVGPVKGLAAHEPGRNTAEALQMLAAPVMEPQAFDDCMAAISLYTEISQIVRLCIDGAFNPKEAPAGLIDLVCRAGDCPDIATLEGEVKRLSKAVRKAFVAAVKNGG